MEKNTNFSDLPILMKKGKKKKNSKLSLYGE
jgi:hypothetical protein